MTDMTPRTRDIQVKSLPGIYVIVNLCNNKLYVGQSSNIRNRFYSHKTAIKNTTCINHHLNNAVKKYGAKNFILIPLFYCDKVYLDFFESCTIAIYNTNNSNFGYNKTTGGNLNKHVTEETRHKLSLSHIGKKKSIISRQKISEALKNRPKSEEHKLAMKKSKSEKHKLAMRKPKSEEHRIKIKLARVGEKNKCAKLTSQQVYSLRIEYALGNISQYSLAIKYNVSRSTIAKIVNNKSWVI